MKPIFVMMGCLLKLQEDNIIIAIPALVKYKNGQKRATRRACPYVQMMHFMQKENAMLSIIRFGLSNKISLISALLNENSIKPDFTFRSVVSRSFTTRVK